MLGLLFLGSTKCSILEEYHAFYYSLITRHSEVCVVLTMISLMVLFLGYVSPFISLVPIVSMILKYANLRLVQFVHESETISLIFGAHSDSLKKIFGGIDKFALAIPLLSLMISYIIMSLIELMFFLIGVLLVYLVAESMNLDLKTDLYLVTIGSIFLLIMGISLIYIMRKIKNIFILFGCCIYYAFYFLTCCDIAGVSDFDMKNFFSSSQNYLEQPSNAEIVLFIITFTSVLCQSLLYPALIKSNKKKNTIPVYNKDQKKCKIEPSNDLLDRMHYENFVLKSRLENLEKKIFLNDETP